MIGRSKKTVSEAYKEKLLAEIAHYDKRIEEALNKRKQNVFVDESFEEHITNPYKFQLQPLQYELKKQEASLSDRASMTLELAMLTIMQSEVNIMVTPPEVRRPVPEDGVWHEVAAECKIDLVSFAITFYAHKPYRRFAPVRYQNVAVSLVKPAHQTELSQSILPKMKLPNLALQVLQSYATAFRSRRTTLLELAERYAEKLKMQAMPEGGYRVRFLDLLQVDWTLENLWSPVIPFCHRMKFEVEYMPKDYISAISKVYKQFKDPSLETSERTAVLAKIFDICLQAATPAREMQESFESDPETAGRLHERRTTIDQEPDVPRVEHSPKKPSGKENRAQNRKTDMAPPKTIPKKTKKSKPNQDNTSESRKSVKRAMESDNSNAKRSRNDNDVNSRAGLKGGSAVQDRAQATVGLNANVQERDGKQAVTIEKEVVEGNARKKSSNKVTAKTIKETVKATVDQNDAMSKGDGKTLKSKAASNNEVVGTNNNNKNNVVGSSKDSSEASSKGSKKNNVKNVKSNDVNTQNDVGKTKKGTQHSENIQNDKTVGKHTVRKAQATVGLNANVQERDGKQAVTIEKEVVESNAQKKSSNKVTAKTVKETAKTTVDQNDAMSKGNDKILKAKAASNNEVVGTNNNNKNNVVGGSKDSSEATSKGSKKNNVKNVKSNDVNTQNDAGKTKKGTEHSENIQNDKTVSKHSVKENNVLEKVIASTKDAETKKNTQNDKPTGKNSVKAKDKNKENNAVIPENTETTTSTKNNNKIVGSSTKDDANVGNSKRVTKKAEDSESVTSKVKNAANDLAIPKIRITKDIEENATNNKHVNDAETVSKASSKTVTSKDDGKDKGVSKNIKARNAVDTVSNKIAKNVLKDTNKDGVGKISDKATDVVKPFKDNVAKKNADKNNPTNKNSNAGVTKANSDKKTKEIHDNASKKNADKNNQINGKNNAVVAKANKNKKETVGSEKSKVIKEKQTGNVKMPAKVNTVTGREKAQQVEKRKANPKTTEHKDNNDKVQVDKTFTKDVRNDEQKDTNDEVSTKKRKTTEINKNEDQPKNSAENTEKPKNNPKLPVNPTRILNIKERVKKAAVNNKMILNTIKTVPKPKIIPISKLPAQKQINIADKLKTKIPMLKNGNKMTFPSLSNKLGMNVGKIGGVEKTKIPKSLPVFKKAAKDLPTRISPRKPFKPSFQGYSTK